MGVFNVVPYSRLAGRIPQLCGGRSLSTIHIIFNCGHLVQVCISRRGELLAALMVLAGPFAELWVRWAEKAVDLAVHTVATGWHLRGLEHQCAPTLSCPEVNCGRSGAPDDCAYYILVIRLLWTAVGVLLAVVAGLTGLVVALCLRGRPARAKVASAPDPRAQALAVRAKYGPPSR